MTDFQLTVEFPPFAVVADFDAREWIQDTALPNYQTNVAGINECFVAESTIDLSGRTVLQDETVYFRSSFEQVAGPTSISWLNQIQGWEGITECVIVSSVPLTQPQMVNATFSAPGFIPFEIIGDGAGNFDRTHIIHGRSTSHHLNTVAGSGPTNTTSIGYLLPVGDNYFSSLEPTAADTLYCYRILLLSEVQPLGGARTILLPAKRVIMDCMSEAEPTLEYMMRLKRSYELANQV